MRPPEGYPDYAHSDCVVNEEGAVAGFQPCSHAEPSPRLASHETVFGGKPTGSASINPGTNPKHVCRLPPVFTRLAPHSSEGWDVLTREMFQAR